MQLRVVAIERESALEYALCGQPVPVEIELEARFAVIRLDERRVDLERDLMSFRRVGGHRREWNQAHVHLTAPSAGDAGVGARTARILLQRLLEVLERDAQTVLGEAIAVKLTFQARL